MAEVIGLIASIIAIAETGIKVATALGKLSIKLKNAGKAAKEIARKIKLVSKVLKQVEVKLRAGQGSIDLSLVEDYILLCEERMNEANRLVDILENEMNSPRSWERAKFRIRFILEKSTFTLLQQDMDSLHLTLDLYVTTLTYQQVGKNEAILEEIQEKLVDLKQEVEDDLQIRSASSTVHAAILTIQYNNYYFSNNLATSQSAGPGPIVEEVGSDDGNDHSDAGTQASDQALSLLMSRSDIGSPDSSQPVPLSVLDDEMVSKALVVFTQIQTVQKKTLRKVNLELEKGPGSSVLPKFATSTGRNEEASNPLSHASSHTYKGVDPQIENDNVKQKASINRNKSSGSQNSTTAISKQSEEELRPQLEETKSNDARIDHGQVVGDQHFSFTNLVHPTPSPDVAAKQQELFLRQSLATSYSGRFFAIINFKTGKAVQIDFSNLRTSQLSQIILDMHIASLTYDPPRPHEKPAGKEASAYHPPVFPSITSSAGSRDQKINSKLKTLFTSSGDWRSQDKIVVPGTRDQRREPSPSPAVSAFAEYVTAYAQWYTDSCVITALKNNEYLLNFESQSGLIHRRVPLGEEYEHLEPRVNVSVTFVSRQLINENMVMLSEPYKHRTWVFVDEGPYTRDLTRLEDECGFKFLD